ncbi:protein N-lysine methyltransferase METTL21D-like [Ischnura elegans]|uniref:protein N-lysine methyltransferase METTL21D-like n=1 Tax=Ischnura elegans TaxID=197161 RepID=UPI001ED88B99|nr:protein N-lysine methyltransferase METTL21D-like [Ischnura elegans]
MVDCVNESVKSMTMVESNTRFFTRVLDLEGIFGPLKLIQKEVGDTSCVVWDASVVLAKYLETLIQRKDNKEWLKEKTVVELGAGIGGAGLTAASFGADVVVTDLPEVMSMLWANIDVNRFVWDANGGRIVAKELTWGKDSTSDWPTPDLILVADCVYYEQSLEPLIKTMEDLCGRETEVLICQELRDSQKQRDFWEKFLELLKGKFHVTQISAQDQHPQFSSPDIILLSVRKRFES